jgi:hypothetical protein
MADLQGFSASLDVRGGCLYFACSEHLPRRSLSEWANQRFAEHLRPLGCVVKKPSSANSSSGLPRPLALELPNDLIEALIARVVERLREQPERRFLSKTALAAHLGITERRVKTLRERGMPARKIGRDLYFSVDEVNRWLDREGVA